jgi:hypothetical protein
MFLSNCCQAGPKTIVNDSTFGFCSKCLDWSEFTNIGPEPEEFPLEEYLDLIEDLMNQGRLLIFDPNTKTMEKPATISINGKAIQITKRERGLS